MGKGTNTRAAILEQAIHIACHDGLERVTIGSLADQLGMSKSGVHVHFGSHAKLQLEVVKAYACKFEAAVMLPALSSPAGLPRLHTILAHWIRHLSSAEGRDALCINCAAELEGPATEVREELVSLVRSSRAMLETCVRQAVKLGQLAANADDCQLAHELHGMMLLLHHDTRFMRQREAAVRTDKAVRRLLEGFCSSAVKDSSPRSCETQAVLATLID
ncbi:TetR/AcrR family transcriptional regulator [Noviherbaspirillum saxi]|uniref:TetR/AcrR family transcriptional regulator n=1 Tax=Noviherbaspirillum saxi TaxID=2320863 RepID=A0A3A3FWJ2_9BURK|nr:TetR/AcrR family transcriptional regulator [Noviherbaspirillum saxi]RJF98531.1 TetR/AcrR family transcriptional regulator [Noviherbaspirillum saxi]